MVSEGRNLPHPARGSDIHLLHRDQRRSGVKVFRDLRYPVISGLPCTSTDPWPQVSRTTGRSSTQRPHGCEQPDTGTQLVVNFLQDVVAVSACCASECSTGVPFLCCENSGTAVHTLSCGLFQPPLHNRSFADNNPCVLSEHRKQGFWVPNLVKTFPPQVSHGRLCSSLEILGILTPLSLSRFWSQICKEGGFVWLNASRHLPLVSCFQLLLSVRKFAFGSFGVAEGFC